MIFIIHEYHCVKYIHDLKVIGLLQVHSCPSPPLSSFALQEPLAVCAGGFYVENACYEYTRLRTEGHKNLTFSGTLA